jgi:hypothetical protein
VSALKNVTAAGYSCIAPTKDWIKPTFNWLTLSYLAIFERKDVVHTTEEL